MGPVSSLSLCGQVFRAVEFLHSQVLFRNKGTIEFLGQSNDMCSLSLKNEAGVYGLLLALLPVPLPHCHC